MNSVVIDRALGRISNLFTIIPHSTFITLNLMRDGAKQTRRRAEKEDWKWVGY